MQSSPTATGHSSISSGESTTANILPCCANRTTTIVGNVFLLVAGSFYGIVALIGLNDHTANAPNELERKLLITALVSCLFQVPIAGLAIWGAVTYRTWPVKIQLGWLSIGIIVLSFTGVVISHNPLLIVPILIQILLFWMPMYSFVVEYRQHPYEVARLNVTDDGREIEMLWLNEFPTLEGIYKSFISTTLYIMTILNLLQ